MFIRTDFFRLTLNFIKKNAFAIILTAIFAFCLLVRILPSWDIVFSDPVKYSADDGIYHMRLVENMLLGGHFPFRIYFDPYTNFPNGSYIHFTPLFDWIMAVIIWLISFGKPTLESINRIAPFVSAIMGSGLVFLVYFLYKAIFKNKIGGLLASFFAGISSVFLFRSVLGYTDHHVAEVFFSTLAMLFLVFALQARKNRNPKKFNFKNEIKTEKRFWAMSLLSGFSLGLYFLAWTGAIMFLFLIFLFLVLYYLLQYSFKDRQNWVLWLGMTIFLVSFLMILPFFGHPDLFHTYMYNIVHVLGFSLGFLAFVILLLSDKLFLKKKLNPRLISLFFAGLLILLLAGLKIFFPVLFDYLISGAKEINTGMVEYKMARELVGEMVPASFGGLVNGFQMVFIGSLVAMIFVVSKFIYSRKPEFLLLPLWAVFIMLAAGLIPVFGQVRFTYYLAPVFAVLFAYLMAEMFGFGWESLQKAKEVPEASPLKKYINFGGAAIIFLVFFALLYPFPFNLDAKFPKSLPYILQPIAYNTKLSIADQDRYDLTAWLRDNTPDPGVDYYELYKEPGINKETGKVNDYKYPDSAYGILAVWDLGHMITYYSHRIPVANPFQEGIGRKNADGTIIPGWATFFLEEDEKTATKYLDSLKVKYVVTDSGSANADGVYQQMIKWQQDNLDGFLAEDKKNIDMDRYYDSMIAKLALFDGKETSINGLKIAALSHFRLVYESATTGFTLKIDNNQSVKQYKVFEYVKGDAIIGKAVSGTQVEASINLKTNQGREFIYKNTAVADKAGNFKIIVPYTGEYKLKIGTHETFYNNSGI